MKAGNNLLHYRLEEKLAEGGQGQVWLAYNPSTDEKVAIKIPSEADAIESLAEEHRVLLKLRKAGGHPNIISIIDYFPTHHPSFLVLEYKKGLNLAEYVEKYGAFSSEDFKEPLLCILKALEFAHDNGVFHRDITPANILIDEDTMEAYLLDFGLSKITDENLSRMKLSYTNVDESIVGKPEWIPPEVREGKEYTAASDLYGIGLITIYALTGARPATRKFWKHSDDVHFLNTLSEFVSKTTTDIAKSRPKSIEEAKKYLISIPDGNHASDIDNVFEERRIVNQFYNEIMKADYSDSIFFLHLTMEVARELAKYKDGDHDLPRDLVLDVLTSMTPEDTSILAQHKGWLNLRGLTSISIEVACELSKSKAVILSLTGLTSITEEVAAELAKCKALILTLHGLTEVSAEVARELAKYGGWLELSGLTSITEEVAAELAKCKNMLSMNGLTSISVEVARELAKCRCSLLMIGLTSITEEIARELAKYKSGMLFLSGLTSITKEVAAELAKYKLGLSINGLISISVEVAREFAKYGGFLELLGLTSISAEVARDLAKHRGMILAKSHIDEEIEKYKE